MIFIHLIGVKNPFRREFDIVCFQKKKEEEEKEEGQIRGGEGRIEKVVEEENKTGGVEGRETEINYLIPIIKVFIDQSTMF